MDDAIRMTRIPSAADIEISENAESSKY